MSTLAIALWVCVGGAFECSPRNDFEVVGAHDQRTHLSDYADRELVVVVFFGTECPLAKLYAPRINALAGQYSAAGVAFLGINANEGDSIDSLARFADQNGVRFPLFKDPDGAVADQFGAARQLEVFVLDHCRNVKYHGRVDDQYATGVQCLEPARDDLKEALEDLLSGKSEIAVPETENSSCLIVSSAQPTASRAVAHEDFTSIAVVNNGHLHAASTSPSHFNTVPIAPAPTRQITACSLAIVSTIGCWIVVRRRTVPRTSS